MITWDSYAYISLTSAALWSIGAYMAWRQQAAWRVYLSTILGLMIYLSFIVGMWVSMQRPPLRTMGETRMWYAFFLPVAGLAVYGRWRYRWILSFSTLMAVVFICVNILRPEIHGKELMPALQSPWFAPHVIVYMMAYALMGAAALMAIWLLWIKRGGIARDEVSLTDNLVYVGFAFLTFGMLFGALWAKEAWGHYWSWDPKETWAAATWLAYLVYIHLRKARPSQARLALGMLIAAFVLLQMCWWGINYLPSARATSIHTYSL